jgi:electron transfer flavoprotein alpha subunit
VAIVVGDGVQTLAQSLGAADTVLCLEDARLAQFTPRGHTAVLAALAAQQIPHVILVGATSMGIDLASLLSATLGIPMVVNCKDIQIEEDRVVATSQMCGGKLLCEVEATSTQVVLTVLPGAFPAPKGVTGKSPSVESIPVPASLEGLRMSVTRLVKPEAGDVDITKVPVLIGVGRGIQRQDNLPVAEEIAGLLGGAVCASRPVIDQGWMPLSRQVGKSGLVVKPKLYLALGISGASEHVEGMKDAELIIAINMDARAPIYDVADFGVVADLFDIAPALTDALKQRKSSAA